MPHLIPTDKSGGYCHSSAAPTFKASAVIPKVSLGVVAQRFELGAVRVDDEDGIIGIDFLTIDNALAKLLGKNLWSGLAADLLITEM